MNHVVSTTHGPGHPTAAALLDSAGFAVVPDVLAPGLCDSLCRAVEATLAVAPDAAGTRNLLALEWCWTEAQRLRKHPALAAAIPSDHVAVGCTYFEKSVDRNWLVPVHQDLAIPVAQRVDHPLLRGWSHKEGRLFVQPPADVLEQLVAVRVHLDPCRAEDGPLQFVPGTHLAGRIDAAKASGLKREGPVVAPELERGDALLMRPLVLHASSKATGTGRRRVLHFLFGPERLPYGLRWA